MTLPDIRDYEKQRIHMIGIGGSSMSGLAQMLLKAGYTVSGTDTATSYLTQKLQALGIQVMIGHHPEMVKDAGLLVYSAAISAEDPERLEAKRFGIPQMERAVLLGQLMRGYQKTVCVCGTHGKTTTSSMIAFLTMEAGLDPTVHLGGSLDAIGGSVRVGGHDLFVAEACEFNRSFLNMPPNIIVLLNIEEDHLDCYGTMEAVEKAYEEFINLLPKNGILIAFDGDERIKRLLKKVDRPHITFGLNPESEWTMQELGYSPTGGGEFTALHQGKVQGRITLQVPGYYNALHALACIALGHELKVPFEETARVLKAFRNPHRRNEYTGTVRGMALYTDYGHNPEEMRCAVSNARLQNKRLIAVMQPHTYSRVKTLFKDYLNCTQEADITLVTDIFAAREKDPGDINSLMLVEGMREQGIHALLTPGFADVEDYLLINGRAGDLVLTMGCGDINLLNDQMLRNAKERGEITEDTCQNKD